MGLGQENQSHPVGSGRSPQLRAPPQPVDAAPLEMMPPEEESPAGGGEGDGDSGPVLLQALKSSSTRKVRPRRWGAMGGSRMAKHPTEALWGWVSPSGPWGWWSPWVPQGMGGGAGPSWPSNRAGGVRAWQGASWGRA